MQESCEQSVWQTSSIPSPACCLQKSGVLLSFVLNLARLVQESYEQRLLFTSTMFAAACYLQKTGVLLSWVLKLGRLLQELYEQRLLFTSTMPSSACCLQYVDVLLPSKLNLGTFVQELCKQRLLRTSTMPSSRSCLVLCYVRYFNLQVICIVVDTTLYWPHGVGELNGEGGQREGEQTFEYLGRRKHTCHPWNRHWRVNSAF